jgi:hypothetical protein
MGTVYQARDKTLGQHVAIKIPHSTESPAMYAPGLDVRIDEVCLRALEKRPSDRFDRRPSSRGAGHRRWLEALAAAASGCATPAERPRTHARGRQAAQGLGGPLLNQAHAPDEPARPEGRPRPVEARGRPKRSLVLRRWEATTCVEPVYAFHGRANTHGIRARVRARRTGRARLHLSL